MQDHRPNGARISPVARPGTVVLFLTGGLVGVMAYHGTVAPFVWVLAVLLGLRFRDRLPTPETTWRGAGAVLSLFVAAGVLGSIAYCGAVEPTPAFAGACLVALALAPAGSDPAE